MPKKIDPALRERAVRLVREHRAEYPSTTAAVAVVAIQEGVGHESLRRSVAQADIGAGDRDRVTSEEAAEIRQLKAENRRLREDVAILRAATRWPWTRRALLMSATRFYEKAVLDFAQLEQAVVGSDGKLIKTPKDELMKQAGLGRGRNTNIRLTLKAFAQDENLIAYFKSFVAAKFDRNDNDGEAAAA